MIVFKSDRIYGRGGFVSGYVVAMEQYKITGITPVKPSWFSGEFYDFTDKIIIPGFVDIHTHGAGGHPFRGSADDIVKGCAAHLAHGTTTVVPTVSTYSPDTVKRTLKTVDEAMRSREFKGRIAGVHLEGPYIAGGKKGTPEKDDYVPLVSQYRKILRRWTYAPEYDPDGSFCRYLTAHGIVPSAGHTHATAGELMKAAEYGCGLVTHIYSCTSSVRRKNGMLCAGAVEGAFLCDIAVEAVADGRQLSGELLRMIYRIKGPDRTALCSDSVPGGEDATTSDELLRFAVGSGIPLGDAVKMLTRTPADLLHIDGGRIEAGYPIDLAVLDDGLNVTDVFVGGKKVV